jgi:hypothetical protein
MKKIKDKQRFRLLNCKLKNLVILVITVLQLDGLDNAIINYIFLIFGLICELINYFM